MSEPTSTSRSARSAAGLLLVPTFVALELFGGVIQGWITPLLGEIATHYQVGGGAVGWILTVGLLSSAVSVPLMTMLADRYGARRMLVLAVALTAIGSTMIAFAPVFPLVLLGSIVQGPVAAMLPIEMSLLKHHRPESANRIVGILVGTLTFGVALGSLGGGLVMEAVGDLVVAQAIGAAPLVILALVVGFTVPSTAGDPDRVVDWAGAGLFGVALVGVMYGLSEGSNAGWTSPLALVPLVLGLVAFIAFLMVENRATTPLFDVKLLRRAKLGVPMVLGVLVAMTMFGSQTPTVLYLSADPELVGYGAGFSTGLVGIVFASTALVMTAGSFLAPLLARRAGLRATIVAACVLMAAGMVVLLVAPAGPGLATAVFATTALGTGVMLAVLPGVVIDRAPETASASVSGLYNTGRTLGGSLAGALVASIMTAFVAAGAAGTVGDAPPATPFAAFQVIWAIFAAVLIAAAVLALSLGPRRAATPSPATADDALEIGARP
ncbi:MFS transporter [Agromyces sp. LHK192]|uniref:MFS transporter n=1 Tax=Agromyces sp. LHK192 TaxID=2498704 RepID=UPI0013E39FFE|nr:MFS transporter [Agromyces sp. LHK192]